MQEQLSRLLNQRIDLALPLSLNLAKLDAIVKQLAISPTSPSALQACRTLCKQYIGIKPPRSPSSPSSPSQVIDPQVFAHFSFAKSKSRPIKNPTHDFRPERLFLGLRQQEKGRSQDVLRSKNSLKKQGPHYVSNFNLPLNLDQSKSSNFQDVKQMSRLKLEEMEQKQEQLRSFLKKQNLERLLQQIKAESMELKRQFKVRAAQFMYRTALTKNTFQTLKSIRTNSLAQYQKAIQFEGRNHQNTLEEYFQAWKERTFMTELERQFQKEVEDKKERLSKIRFFWNLKQNHKKYQLEEDRFNQNSKKVKQSSLVLKKINVFRCLQQQKVQSNYFQTTSSSLKLTLKTFYLKELMTTIKKFTVFEELKETEKTEAMFKRIYGWKLLTTLKNDHDLMTVYWKNPNKIIFLKMVLEAIKDSMLRKGYCEQEWMMELPNSLERTDKKLGNIGRRHELKKIFTGLRTYLFEESEKTKEVKMIHGKRIFKQLLTNYKFSILREKQEFQQEQFFEKVVKERIKTYFLLFRGNTLNCLDQKKKQVELLLKKSKIQEVFKYFMAHKLVSNYYSDQVKTFEQRRKQSFERKIFLGFKQVTLTSIINKKICQEFTLFRNKCKLQQIFKCIKHYAFQEKLIKKREQALVKIRLSSYFQALTFNMRVDMYSGQKQRELLLSSKQKFLFNKNAEKRIKTFFKVCYKMKLKQRIMKQIDDEYRMRFIQKAFNAMRIVTNCQRRQKKLIEIIQKKSQNKMKSQTLDLMVNSFLIKLLLKNADNISYQCLVHTSFHKIREFSDEIIKNIQHDSMENFEDIVEREEK